VSTLHARDWSRELEESDYCLPFAVGRDDIERGTRGRVVSFLDERCVLPMLDVPSGLGIDVNDWNKRGVLGEEEGDLVGVMGGGIEVVELRLEGVEMESEVESDGGLRREGSGIESLVTDVSATESEWTSFSEQAEGIETLL
jgi:hypothetical protein